MSLSIIFGTIGFLLAAYSVIGNDSAQTLGTFIASNQDKKWWVLWIFIGGIFIALGQSLYKPKFNFSQQIL